jgi:phosphatidylserine/phosphatidylglycerophosphate/cardiolipin synthase-like enzyme
MKKQIIPIIIILSFVFFLLGQVPSASEIKFNNTPTQIYFSPKGGCTEAIIDQIDNAKSEILIQAYSFTSTPIAKALINAHKR